MSEANQLAKTKKTRAKATVWYSDSWSHAALASVLTLPFSSLSGPVMLFSSEGYEAGTCNNWFCRVSPHLSAVDNSKSAIQHHNSIYWTGRMIGPCHGEVGSLEEIPDEQLQSKRPTVLQTLTTSAANRANSYNTPEGYWDLSESLTLLLRGRWPHSFMQRCLPASFRLSHPHQSACPFLSTWSA